ncbi:MAG: magnesium transporter, partial [Gammaproteobacteria bacterium]
MKGRLVETLVHQQRGQNQNVVEELVHRQQQAHLDKLLSNLHAADVARVMESLPQEDRQLVWHLQAPRRGGEILSELSDSVIEQIIQATDAALLQQVLKQLNAEDLGDLAEFLPESMLQARLNELSGEEQAWLSNTLKYPGDSVGALMGRDMVVVCDEVTLQDVMTELRQRKDLPSHSDKLFVTDRRGHLIGILPLQALVLNDPEQRVSEVMAHEVVTFMPEESASNAARAFERYDLVSAPVLNNRGRPIGRLTVDDVIDFVRDDMAEDVLNSAGLHGEEDLFAPLWDSARNRRLWLSLSLLTAFFASRVIGLFEETIARFVALAALMPIVAAIGGNTGNQITTLVVRGLALAQIDENNLMYLIRKELSLSLLNGLVWGTVVGLFALMFYGNLMLAFVIALAMLLTLLLAAVLGLAIP